MGFGEAVRVVLREKYARFSGRAARSEYWWFFLFYFLVLGVLGIVLVAFIGVSVLDQPEPPPAVLFAAVPMILFVLATFIPYLAVTVRRLHDRNMSGWWLLAFIVGGAIPVVGFLATIAMYVILALPGTKGPNRHGLDPLGRSNAAEVFS